MSTPKVSVIMPVFNSALYIKEAVDSILNQSFRDFELICINDCSKDESLSILQSYSDTRIVIIDLDVNKGVANARNIGIQKAKGEYIAFLDSDDKAYANRFEKQTEFLDSNPEIDGVFGKVRLVDVYGNPNGTWDDDINFTEEEEIKKILPVRNCLAQPAAMIRKSSLPEIPYNTEYKDSEDWGLWLEMISAGKRLAKINEELIDYRIRPSSETQKSNLNPLEKLIRFRKTFLIIQRAKKHDGPIEHYVSRALIHDEKEILRETYIRKPIRIFKKVIEANPIQLVIQYFQLRSSLKKIKSNQVVFFFPFCHVGGAEKVHASIVSVAKEKSPTVFFTKKSDNTDYLNAFEENATCHDIWKLCWYPFFKTIAAKAIAKRFNSLNDITLVSSNSVFYYSILPHLNSKVKCVDLIHAFVHPEESSPEKWSLPVVEKLNERIFIGQKAIDDLVELYKKNNIDKNLLNRVKLIRNFVPIPEETPRTSPITIPRIIYIGRGTPEKRVHIAALIGKALQKNYPSLKIEMLGNIEYAIAENLHPYCSFHGIVRDEKKVYGELLKSDILILTSSREGLPMVILEAMACRVIPVVTGVGDIPNVLKHGESGFVLPAEDESKIVEQAVSHIIELTNNPELTNKIRKQARQDVQAMFSEATFVSEWKKVMDI